ncbi:MAG TPA: class I SAM-dependent methyltransferase [Bryobacteraceae bacterium]|nr:class I SAM-dependent methyltransferase [Bryobacteraceae bacterium]
MNPFSVFDQEHYEALNAAREAVLRPLLQGIQRNFQIESALDVGCGSGHFTGLLHGEGLRVVGLDGRAENVALAGSRHPDIPFFTANLEDDEVRKQGPADVVLCFGLLYHLENPFRAVRNLFALTGKVLFVESMCLPLDFPAMELRDECSTADQGLHFVAFYPSEACLTKLLYRAGFTRVYRLGRHPEHQAYRNSARQKKSRTMLVASGFDLNLQQLEYVPEPAAVPDPWGTAWERLGAPLRRLQSLLAKPWPEKVAAVRRRLSGSL